MKKVDKFTDFVKKYNQYISNHNRLVKKCGFESSILGTKIIPLTTIYKLFKKLILKDNTQITDDNLILIIIHILAEKLKLDLNKSKLLHDELINSIPNFIILKKRISISLQIILIITNIVCKETVVINNFEKFLNLKDIPEIVNKIIFYTKEHEIGLVDFSFIRLNKKQKVLKNIVNFIKK